MLKPAWSLSLLLLLAMLAVLIDSRTQITATPLVSSAPLLSSVPAFPQSLPPMILSAGFANDMTASGLLAPRAFEFAPDGRILILERGSDATQDINFASLRVFKNGLLLTGRALTLNVCGDGERGLLGIALDPSFSSNGYLNLYYTRQSTSGIVCTYNTYVSNLPGPCNRVSRFTMLGDSIDPATEQVLIDNIPPTRASITPVTFTSARTVTCTSRWATRTSNPVRRKFWPV